MSHECEDADKAGRTFSDCVDMHGMAVISGELRVKIHMPLGRW